jgi:hypothetical protein
VALVMEDEDVVIAELQLRRTMMAVVHWKMAVATNGGFCDGGGIRGGGRRLMASEEEIIMGVICYLVSHQEGKGKGSGVGVVRQQGEQGCNGGRVLWPWPWQHDRIN